MPPRAGLGFVDQAGVQVGVDRHLLARHGVEGEARRDFRGAHRAVGDHDVLNGDQGDEQHKAHHIVAAHHELPEGLNDLSRRAYAFVAVQQDAAAGGQVQGEPEQGQQQKQAGKNGKLRRPQNLHGRKQHQHRSGHAHRQQQIEQQGSASAPA